MGDGTCITSLCQQVSPRGAVQEKPRFTRLIALTSQKVEPADRNCLQQTVFQVVSHRGRYISEMQINMVGVEESVKGLLSINMFGTEKNRKGTNAQLFPLTLTSGLMVHTAEKVKIHKFKLY